METPIYSDKVSIEKDNKLQEHIVTILSDESVKKINNKITYVNHGVYVFSQYKEKNYIINGYAENIFWTIISRLYVLLHDCGAEVLQYFLQIVLKDGKQSINPFPVTDSTENEQLTRAKKFVEDIVILRHSEQHAMKPDCSKDVSKERARDRILKKISRKDVLDTQDDWEKCISWIVKESNNLYVVLCKRLDFMENEATEFQKEILVGGYYGCIDICLDNSVMDIIAELGKRNHGKYNNPYIKAFVESNKEKIKRKYRELLKSSPRKVDPYKAMLQAAEYYLTV